MADIKKKIGIGRKVIGFLIALIGATFFIMYYNSGNFMDIGGNANHLYFFIGTGFEIVACAILGTSWVKGKKK